jgi:hypothetical protein
MLIRLSAHPIHCVIDALDECEEKSQSQLVADFKRMTETGLTSCRVIITCRPTKSMMCLLNLNDTSTSFNLDYSMGEARDLILAEELSDSKFEHIRAALEKEQASPLKARLIAQMAKKEEKFDLSSYTNYDSVYASLLARVKAPRRWLQDVLLCMSFAQRPLTVNELAAGLGIDQTESEVGSHHSLQQIRISAPKQLKEDLELALGVLVRNEANVVHLVHDTFREFIQNHSRTIFASKRPEISQNIDGTLSSMLLRKCLLFLSIKELHDLRDFAPRRRPFEALSDSGAAQPHSFLSYAGPCWTLHMISAGDDQSQFTQDCFSSFWEHESSRSWWIDNCATFTAEQAGLDPDHFDDRLELASTFGLMTVVRSVLATQPGAAPILPTFNAFVEGDEEMFSTIWFHAGAEHSREDWYDALTRSFQYGHYNILALMLSHWPTEGIGPMPEYTTREGLLNAVRNGHWPLIAQILRNWSTWKRVFDELDVDALISAASSCGRDGVVQVLLTANLNDKGHENSGEIEQETHDESAEETNGQANVAVDDEANKHTSEQTQPSSEVNEIRPREIYHHALLKASEFGSAAVIELLAPGVDLEDKGDGEMSVLHSAAFGRYHPLTLHLLVRNGNSD